MLAPKGAGFLSVRREVQHLLEPLVVSWGWDRGNEVDTLRDLGKSASPFIDEQEWTGARDPAAFRFHPCLEPRCRQAEHDWPRVGAECHACACAQVQASC